MARRLQGLLFAVLVSLVVSKKTGAEIDARTERPRFLYVLPDGSTLERDTVPRPEGAIRFVLISDTHTRENELSIPEGDVLIHAGDVLFRNADRHQNASIREFNDWAKRQPPRHRILIGGNHDQVLEDMGKENAKQAFSAGQYLQDETLVIESIQIYASPQSIPYWGKLTTSGAFENEDHEATAAFTAAIPNGIDILVTHGAPQGHLDLVELESGGWLPGGYKPGDYHIGDPDLAQRVREVRPRIHVFGHVHKPLPRVVKEENTIYINACSVHEFNPLEGDLLLPIMIDVIPFGSANLEVNVTPMEIFM